MEHAEIRDLVAAFAIGAVDDEERREIERHLRTCDECRGEFEGYESAMGAMASTVEPVPLPNGFADRVVSQAIGDEKEERARYRRWWTRIAIGMSAAVIAAVIAIAGTVIEGRNDAERERRVLALLSGDEGISITGAEDVLARVAPAAEGSQFAIAGVDEAPEGRTYQLWLMRGESCPSAEPTECELVSAGTFDTENGVALVDLDHDVEDWENAAVSIEPDEGSDFPTTTPFADSL